MHVGLNRCVEAVYADVFIQPPQMLFDKAVPGHVVA